ncbi:hypothetical protein HanXRQr2_Chr12g0552021 [Helianthus annuus]|uniref:Uncharacterized protein n=1 Tax=Helianthus annuus TaxID=4232 RepID=A0A9K3HIC6_HELAN|nr:hypothetical protein HanXRQr2_Chr12g0552021 [Helianthus annuus]
MVLCRPPLPAASLADARRWSCARRIPTCKHPLTSCLHQKSTLQPLPLSIPPLSISLPADQPVNHRRWFGRFRSPQSLLFIVQI